MCSVATQEFTDVAASWLLPLAVRVTPITVHKIMQAETKACDKRPLSTTLDTVRGRVSTVFYDYISIGMYYYLWNMVTLPVLKSPK